MPYLPNSSLTLRFITSQLIYLVNIFLEIYWTKSNFSSQGYQTNISCEISKATVIRTKITSTAAASATIQTTSLVVVVGWNVAHLARVERVRHIEHEGQLWQMGDVGKIGQVSPIWHGSEAGKSWIFSNECLDCCATDDN